MDKFQLENFLQSKTTTLINKINITIYFENLTFELYALYALNTYAKFFINRIFLLYDLKIYILCITLNYKNLQFKKIIDDITINF